MEGAVTVEWLCALLSEKAIGPITAHHCPPKGRKLREELGHQRYYQFLSGHAATGACLCNGMGKIPSDKCWLCGRNERQTRHHHPARREAWAPQIKALWKSVGRGRGMRGWGPGPP